MIPGFRRGGGGFCGGGVGEALLLPPTAAIVGPEVGDVFVDADGDVAAAAAFAILASVVGLFRADLSFGGDVSCVTTIDDGLGIGVGDGFFSDPFTST